MRTHALLVCVLVALAGCSGQVATGTPTGSHGSAANTGGSAPDLGAGHVTVHVEHIVDGDTIDVSYANGTEDTVRLVGIDTPETHAKNTPGEFPGVPNTTAGAQCLGRWGHRASDFAHSKLADRDVTLVFDPNTDRRGYYGRLLAYVYVGNDSYNYDAVSGGYARVYTNSDFSRKSHYTSAAADARAAGARLWTCQTPTVNGTSGSGTTTTSGSGTTTTSGSGPTTTSGSGPTTTSGPGETTTASDTDGPLSISVHADAAGPDGDNLNDEYVTLTNEQSTALAMGNWTLSDAADHTYTFPGNDSLPVGATVTVHTGSGRNNATDLYWGASSPVWNNDGDTVTVRAANGTRVARHAY